MKVKLGLPINDTFLSHIIYEGLLFIINIVSTRANIKFDYLELPNDSFTETLNSLDLDKVDSIPILFTGNDHIDKFINSLKLTGKPKKKTYRALLKFLRENSDKIKPLGDIDLTPILTHEEQAIDLLRKRQKCNFTAPSLMKIERYAGFTSTEEFYTAKSVKLRMSPDIWIISLLGVYSSFVIGTRYAGSNKDNYYFMFFSPEEILSMLARGDAEYIYTLMGAKNTVAIETLAELLKQTHMEEALALELVTSIELIKILQEYGINKLSLSLVKISPEGQTYKIYEYFPLYLSSETPFTNLLSKFFSETGKALEYLANAIDPRGYLLRATSSKEAKNWSERNYATKAVLALHRLVSLNDASGLRDYAHYLRLASEALRGSKDKKSIMRQSYYEHLLTQLATLH